MAWNTKSYDVEPEISCPIIDSVISEVNESIDEAKGISNICESEKEVELAESIAFTLSFIEEKMEEIRKINETLRDQRKHYKDKVDKVEEILY